MHEKTFIASMIGLDVMLIMAGGVMAWGHAVPRRPPAPGGADPITAIISTVIITLVGAWVLYELNEFVFKLAESPSAARNARWVAFAFAAATVIGGLTGMTLS